jgi:hypothetical protein
VVARPDACELAEREGLAGVDASLTELLERAGLRGVDTDGEEASEGDSVCRGQFE